jgi:Domain of unknown function (DUF4439)
MSDTTALQSCLAAEHAAVYGYGVLAAVIHDDVGESPADRRASAAFRGHRRSRDELTARLVALNVTPVAATAAYRLPFPVRGPLDAARLARHLEAGCSAAYARGVAQSVDDVRGYLAHQLAAAAVAAVAWGARPTAFPGTHRA